MIPSKPMSQPDAIVVDAGPNGLAAAIVIAQTGRKVIVFEAESSVGGGARSAELTLPGFVHDICSAVHPFARASPLFRTLPLEAHGLEWIEPPAMLAHPFDDGSCSLIHRSVERTASGLHRDAGAYRNLIGRIVDAWPMLEGAVLAPPGLPRHPLAVARFGVQALRSADTLTRQAFADDRTRALFAGICAHSMLPLDRRPTAAFGLVFRPLVKRASRAD